MAVRRPNVWLLGLACLGFLLVASQAHPLAQLALGTWVPLPVILVGWRSGERSALGLAVAAALLVSATQPTLKGMWENLSIGELLLVGVLLSSFRNRGISPAPAIIMTAGTLALVALFFLLIQAAWAGQSPLALFHQKARETAQTLEKVFAQTGMETRSWLPLGGSPWDWETLVSRIFPGLFVINVALVAWLNTAAALFLARVLNWPEAGLPLSDWSNPEWLIFLFLGAGFLLLAPLASLRLIGLNLLLVTGFLYFCQGVAVVAATFQRFQAPLFLRLLGYPLLFVNPVFFLVIILGLADLWLDFRRLHRPHKT